MRKTLLLRALTPRVQGALKDAPVVIVVGPRQSGKSTVACQVIPERYVSLDDPGPLAAATADPDGFIAQFTRPTALDEVQNVLERRDGSVVGIDVKASVGVTAADFRGLRALSTLLKRKFVRGIVLHPGRQTIGFAEQLTAVPLSALWTSA